MKSKVVHQGTLVTLQHVVGWSVMYKLESLREMDPAWQAHMQCMCT